LHGSRSLGLAVPNLIAIRLEFPQISNRRGEPEMALQLARAVCLDQLIDSKKSKTTTLLVFAAM